MTFLKTPKFGDLKPFTIGFDEMFNDFKTLSNSYPPYNIRKIEENKYAIEMALAGFKEADIDISVVKNRLTVKADASDGDSTNYLFRGLAKRNVEKTFALADNVNVTGADYSNGILNIMFEREVLEEEKPKQIAITVDKAA